MPVSTENKQVLYQNTRKGQEKHMTGSTVLRPKLIAFVIEIGLLKLLLDNQWRQKL